MWDWTVPDVVIVVTAHLLKRVNNIIHFHSCQHVDHEYNCSSPEQKPNCYFVDLLREVHVLNTHRHSNPGGGGGGGGRAPPIFYPQDFINIRTSAQIVVPQCILRSAPPKWNCFLRL